MLDELKTTQKVVGVKQLLKALSRGQVKKVFVANDADPMLTDPVIAECNRASVAVILVPTMRQLGAACEISVDAAAAAIL